VRRLAVLAFVLLLLTLSAGPAVARHVDSCCDDDCHGMTVMCLTTSCASCPAEALVSSIPRAGPLPHVRCHRAAPRLFVRLLRAGSGDRREGRVCQPDVPPARNQPNKEFELKTKLLKLTAACALVTASAAAFAAGGCCGDLMCCLQSLACCFQ
jgi:hypothetical protein